MPHSAQWYGMSMPSVLFVLIPNLVWVNILKIRVEESKNFEQKIAGLLDILSFKFWQELSLENDLLLLSASPRSRATHSWSWSSSSWSWRATYSGAAWWRRLPVWAPPVSAGWPPVAGRGEAGAWAWVSAGIGRFYHWHYSHYWLRKEPKKC